MERLKIRQRLEKLNTPLLTKMTTSSQSEKSRLEPTKRLEQEDPIEMRNSELAGKSRVQSIILNSIPDRPIRQHKPLSHVTPQMIADFQFEESKPIEINGQIYRMHPASIPEPEFEQVPNSSSIIEASSQHMVSEIERLNTSMKDIVQLIKNETRELESLRQEYKNNDTMYDKYINTLEEKYSDALKIGDWKEKKQIAKHIDETRQQYPRVKRKIEDAIDDKIMYIHNLRISLEQSQNDLEGLSELDKDLVSETFLIKQRNAQKLKEYEDNLKQLNRDFNLQQQVGETEEEYIQRIQQATSAIEDPTYVETRMLLHDATLFKNNMKDIIRDPSTIEYVYNAISQDEEHGIGSINQLNSIFPLVKSRYERMYGMNQIKDVDLVKFLLDILSNPVESVKQIEREDTPQSNKYRVLETTKDGRRNVFSKQDLLEWIGLLYPYTGDISIYFQNKNYTLSKGSRGGLNINNKTLTQYNLPEIRTMFIAVMEKAKTDNPSRYDSVNKYFNTLSDGKYGEGFGVAMDAIPKVCQFGHVELDLHKLFYKNILSIKQKGLKINGFKNAPVSDEFVSIVMQMCKGINPTARELQKLPERQLYDTLLHVAGIHKKIEHTADRTIEELQKRLTLVEGEIEAGNTNHELLQELKSILYKLHHLGVITQNNMKLHFKDIKQQFF